MLRPKIELKTPEQVDEMRPANRLVAQCLIEVSKAVAPGVTTHQLDAIVERMFEERGAKPLFKGYPVRFRFPLSLVSASMKKWCMVSRVAEC